MDRIISYLKTKDIIVTSIQDSGLYWLRVNNKILPIDYAYLNGLYWVVRMDEQEKKEKEREAERLNNITFNFDYKEGLK